MKDMRQLCRRGQEQVRQEAARQTAHLNSQGDLPIEGISSRCWFHFLVKVKASVIKYLKIPTLRTNSQVKARFNTTFGVSTCILSNFESCSEFFATYPVMRFGHLCPFSSYRAASGSRRWMWTQAESSPRQVGRNKRDCGWSFWPVSVSVCSVFFWSASSSSELNPDCMSSGRTKISQKI